MPKYTVYLYYRGCIEVRVEAENKEQAGDLALDRVCDQDKLDAMRLADCAVYDDDNDDT